MGCISGIAKYVLFVFNFLIVVCGIALIAVGAIILVNENQGLDSFTDFSAGGFAIAVGVIIFIIAFFGCCGAIKENSCMLTTYAVILIVLLILQVVLGALAFVALRDDDNKLTDEVYKMVKDLFAKYNTNADTDDTKAVDNIQKYFDCCGVNGPEYWTNSGITIPASCYDDTTLRKTGCATAFQDAISYFLKVIGGIAIGFAVVELVGAIFAFMVRNR